MQSPTPFVRLLCCGCTLTICVLLLTATSGCRVNIRSRDSVGTASHPPTSTQTAFKEIRAACELSFSADQRAALVRIAKRPEFDSSAQVEMIKLSSRSLAFTSDKRIVFNTIINHPHFSEAAKGCMIDHLKHIDFESDRKALLAALSKRSTRPADRPAHVDLDI